MVLTVYLPDIVFGYADRSVNIFQKSIEFCHTMQSYVLQNSDLIIRRLFCVWFGRRSFYHGLDACPENVIYNLTLHLPSKPKNVKINLNFIHFQNFIFP